MVALRPGVHASARAVAAQGHGLAARPWPGEASDPPGEPDISGAHISNEKLLDKATARTYMLGVSLVKVVSNPNGGDALG